MNHKELISKFKALFKIATDADLAHVLGEKPYIVSGWKTERRPIPVGVKLRLLDHIKFSPDIKRLAAVFVESEEHEVQLLQDLDRLEELKRRQAGMPVSFAEQMWIERVAELQERNSLNDVQAAKYLEIEVSEFKSVKAGRKSLGLKSKSILLFPDAER